jgi:hypothetical protein
MPSRPDFLQLCSVLSDNFNLLGREIVLIAEIAPTDIAC